MTDAEALGRRLAELERLVTQPTLVSDTTLRFTIASLMGWKIDASYWRDRGKPWAANYYADRCASLQATLDGERDE